MYGTLSGAVLAQGGVPTLEASSSSQPPAGTSASAAYTKRFVEGLLDPELGDAAGIAQAKLKHKVILLDNPGKQAKTAAGAAAADDGGPPAKRKKKAPRMSSRRAKSLGLFRVPEENQKCVGAAPLMCGPERPRSCAGQCRLRGQGTTVASPSERAEGGSLAANRASSLHHPPTLRHTASILTRRRPSGGAGTHSTSRYMTCGCSMLPRRHSVTMKGTQIATGTLLPAGTLLLGCTSRLLRGRGCVGWKHDCVADPNAALPGLRSVTFSSGS